VATWKKCQLLFLLHIHELLVGWTPCSCSLCLSFKHIRRLMLRQLDMPRGRSCRSPVRHCDCFGGQIASCQTNAGLHPSEWSKGSATVDLLPNWCLREPTVAYHCGRQHPAMTRRQRLAIELADHAQSSPDQVWVFQTVPAYASGEVTALAALRCRGSWR
jgi:hypothetical protein